ncbi:YkvA family protein [Sporosalibacterium faouarense]|uniref:YkvA family protein n=1 Tax=Sporosalibacterium faouarense TaxID=516123 RepID=UPI00141CAC0D|nr:DUF1232 domain-containing protein [Sporosalibacterium faouarense]MTI48462.1 DUF1232 domain-containing protein [Bacillota bacterium]
MSFFRKIPLAFKYLFDSQVPFRKKLPFIFGAIYFISPIDLAPEAILLHFGIIDDLTLLGFLISKLSKDLDGYIDERGEKKKDINIKGNVIENVEYDIKDDKK